MRWAEILSKYYFEIKHIKESDNVKMDVLSQQVKLQEIKKPLKTMLKLYKNGKIKYNHLKLVVI